MGIPQRLGTIPLAIFTDASNNVGIGGSPSGSYKLDVTGTGRFTDTLNIIANNSTAYSLNLFGRTLDNATTLNFYSNNGATRYGFIYTEPTNMQIGVNGAVRMTIASSGNVGIGTSSPSYPLDVQYGGSLSQRIRNNAAGGTATLLLETANTFSGTSQAYVQCIGSAGGGQSQLVFATAGASGDTSAIERMRINSSGLATIPNQASFYATSNAGSSSYTGGEVIVFNTTRHNTGSYYNTSSGRFTAPVAGKYLFSLNVYSYGGHTTQIVLTINGAQYQPQDVSPLCYAADVAALTTGFTVVFDLAAGDYVEPRVRAGGYAQIYRAHSHFTGQLLS